MEVHAVFRLQWKHKTSSELIAKAIGVIPDKTWRIGDPKAPGAAIRHDRNGFHVRSRCSEHIEIEHHIEWLAQYLYELRDEVRRVVREHALAAEISCAVYYDPDVDPTPAIEVSPESVSTFAFCHAGLSIDLIHCADE